MPSKPTKTNQSTKSTVKQTKPTKSNSQSANSNSSMLAILVFVMGSILLLTSAVLLITQFNSNTIISDDPNTSENTPGDENNNESDPYDAFTPVTSQDVLDLIASAGTGFLYVGRPTCPNCTTFAPLLSAVVLENDFTVLYYDTDVAKSNPDLKSQALDAISVEGVPSFMYIENGEIIEKLTDRKTEDSIKAFFDKYQ